MNFSLFLFVVWSAVIHVEAPIAGRKWFDPLPVLYYPLQERYTLSSTDIVEKMLSATNINKPAFSLILLFCPSTALSHRKTLPSVYQTTKGKVWCEKKFSLNIFHHADHYDYGIGYKFQKNIASHVEHYELPEFSLKYNHHGYEMLVIWYDRDRSQGYTSLTLHHFYTYNHSFLPSTSTCADYHAEFHDPEHHHEFDVEPFFMPEHQNKLFQRFEGMPTPSDDLKKNPLREYLVMHRMVPTDDFIEESKRMATCTSLNTAAVWKSISEGPIRKVEQFIRRVAEHVYEGSLFVKTKHSNPSTYKTRTHGKEESVYLDFENKRIPVNAYFVKIIGYSVPFPIKSEEEINNKHSEAPMYYMVIVIHNQLSDSNLRLCNEKRIPVCIMYGWDMEFTDDERKLAYCCSMEDVKAKEIVTPWHHHNPHKTFDLAQVVTRSMKNGSDFVSINIVSLLNGKQSVEESEESENGSQQESETSEISTL